MLALRDLLNDGGNDERDFPARDPEYARDLGLIARDDPLRIAKPIYAEVVPRELTETGLVENAAWCADANGELSVAKLLAAFQAFFREHSEHWVERCAAQAGHPMVFNRDGGKSWQ